MCYQHRGFIREISYLTGSFFNEITNLQLIRGEFRCATSTGSSSLRDLSHGHNGSYEGWYETTATIRRQTCDPPPPPPDVKRCDVDIQQWWRRQQRRQRREGWLIIDRNDNDDGGVGSDFDDELNEDDGRTQWVIWNGMVATYDFFPSLYSQWGYGSDKLE